MIREAVRKVERWLGMDKGSSGRRRRRPREIGTEGSNPRDSRGRNRVSRARGEGERSGTVTAARGQEVDEGVQMAPWASPKQLQQLPTKADIPGPFNGCQMMIHDAH